MENKGLLFIRKFIATAMIVVLLLTCAPLGLVPEELSFTKSASAVEIKEGLYTYEYENGNVAITGVDNTISGNITIPSKLGGYKVVKIESYAFDDCNNISGLVIPSTVETIEYNSFYSCDNLKSIVISNGVKTIGSMAFGRTAIESITIPASVIDLDSSAFHNCSNLKSINVAADNSKYTSVSGVLFDKDKSTLVAFPIGSDMASYTIPTSVTKIADYAFSNAVNLNSVTMSKNLVNIGEYAFEECSLLKSITLPESVKVIGEGAFSSCSGLISAKLPSDITVINDYTFSGCYKLQNLNIPTTVKYIGYSAFSYCRNFRNFTLHDGIEYIGQGAFHDTPYYNDASNFDNGVFYIGKYLLGAKYNFSAETYTVKNGTVLIAESAFYNTKVKKITLPSTVKVICDNAFRSCANLAEINYPDSLEYIGERTLNDTAYYKNTAKWENDILYVGKHLIEYKNKTNTSYAIKEGTKTIADYAFTDSNNTVITLPASLDNISGFPFATCTELVKIVVNASNKSFTAIDGVLFSKDKTELILYPSRKAGTEYTVPSGVKTIGQQAFYFNNLDTITLSNTVEIIGEDAFAYGDAFTFVLPKSVKYIDKDALSYYTVNVGYLGSESEWNKIGIHPDNENLAYAKVIFNYVPHTHSYTSKVTKEPNCKESGLRTYTCACGANYSTYIFDSSAHKLDSGKVTKKATYKKTGKKIYVCTICGETVKEEKIPKLTVAKVKGLKAKSMKVESSSSFTLSWSKVSGADKYEVYRQSGKKWKKIGTTTKNSLTVKRLKAGSTYKFKVRAIRTKDKINGAYSDVYSVKIAPSKPSLSLKAGKKQLTASWKKLTGVTGFEVQSSTSNKFTKKTTKTATVKKASATKTTIKKLSKGKKYYVRVRAYKTVSGKKIYGNWSSVKNVKVK